MDRRYFIGKSLASGLALSTLAACTDKTAQKKRLFRVVHITDTHILPSEKIEKALEKLTNEIGSLEKRPDFVLHTGDNIMDSLKQPKENVQKQWEAWKTYFRDKLELPFYPCIGNHDVWGWGLEDAHVKEDPLFGKAWAIKMLELPERYYSFENKGWKFVCLDSPYYVEDKHTYTAKLDEEQFNWLRSELQDTNPEIPVCIVSHIPILSPSVFFDGDNEKSGDWEVPGAWMHIDARRIKGLFYKHKNIKAALSGHVHLADKAEYLGVHYHCNGAACGAWWEGSYQEFAPAYALVDFYDDGTIDTELRTYLV